MRRALAILVLAALWGLPWAAWLGDFPAHMLRHMGLVAVAAPLLAPAAWSGVPVVLAAGIEFAVVWGWHLPAAHHFAGTGLLARMAEQGAFLLAGMLVWAAAADPERPLAGAVGLLLTSMHMTLLGALIILAPRVLYHGDLAGQQLGGLMMLGIGTPVYLVAGLLLVRRALGPDRSEGLA